MDHTFEREIARGRLWGYKETADYVDLSVRHLRRLVRSGRFPKPVKIGERKEAWPVGVIMDHVAQAKAPKHA